MDFEHQLVMEIRNQMATVAMRARDAISPADQAAIGYARILHAEHDAVSRWVLRQMRWSRHSFRWANPEGMDWDFPMDPTEEVTSLAPDGWSDEITSVPK